MPLTREAQINRWKVFASFTKARVVTRCQGLQVEILWTLRHR